MEIVKRSDDVKGFVVLPGRWASSVPSPGSDETGVFARTQSPPSSLPQAACQGAARELDKLPVCNARWVGVRKG